MRVGEMSATASAAAQLRVSGDDRREERHGNDQYQHRDGFNSLRCHLVSLLPLFVSSVEAGRTLSAHRG